MRLTTLFAALLGLLSAAAYAAIFGQIHGIVHDPQHRPVGGARVELRSAHSDFTQTVATLTDGSFAFNSIPLGDYSVTVAAKDFNAEQQSLTLASDTSPILHFELSVASVAQSILVDDHVTGANVNTSTPTTLISRNDVAQTPGASRSNSLAMITDFVPGAYMTHDMLHMRGGHQLSWLIDGVEVPNTNIASNLAAQIDPRDIDYLEVQRGSYTADTGDRTYGAFNVVPRTGFDRDREAELVVSGGNFAQTDDQLNFGDHTERLAYYASLNGNRSDYGLSPPIGAVYHDATNGYGGFGSLINNVTPHDQLGLVSQLRADYFQVPYDPNATDFESQQFDSSGLRDGQHETDGLATFSWLHTFNPATVLQLSPFYHYNSADYAARPSDTPVATTDDRASTYAGGQAAINASYHRNDLQAGVYGFGQHDSYRYGLLFNDGSGRAPTNEPDSASGGVVEEYVSDNYKPTEWLTLIAGLRESRFQGSFTETATAPRFGAAVRVPRLNWVFRGFYGHFYQPPPLLTAAGSVAAFAAANGTGFAPLHGERDEEHQFGVQVPLAGWLLDVDTFKTRITNFLDHSNVGDSSLYFPVTVSNARVRAWELSLRSPRIWRLGQAHLAYSNQIADEQGSITGGLVCVPASACLIPTYSPVDHDQRNTLSVGFTASLPWKAYLSSDVEYGSGFHNGNPDPATPYPNPYLPAHRSVDLAAGRSFGDRVAASVNVTNVGNERVLVDNSLTFGGFHYNDPRSYYGEVRYRFRY